MPRAAEVIAALQSRGQSVCTVESLTGGLLCAALTDIPGASAVVRGGVVAYTVEAKRDVVGVDPQLLETHGAVSEAVARALAERAREIFGATWALSTTGVAGPAEQEGKPVGTVFLAVAGPCATVRRVTLVGDRAAIRKASCDAALDLLNGLLAQ
ncbi:MAG TPA: CinA family protein [Actinomycetota bacterium]|nr:CinA family protein [Actinomycetota bacterium]